MTSTAKQTLPLTDPALRLQQAVLHMPPVASALPLHQATETPIMCTTLPLQPATLPPTLTTFTLWLQQSVQLVSGA